MATQTTNYQLKKPATTDPVSIADINNNMDILDTELKAHDTQIGDVVNHKNDTTSHITAAERTAWNAKLNQSGGTMTGALVAQTNTNYTTRQVRNVIISTSDPSGGSSGDIWIKYS